jgi:hypothetical protein
VLPGLFSPYVQRLHKATDAMLARLLAPAGIPRALLFDHFSVSSSRR